MVFLLPTVKSDTCERSTIIVTVWRESCIPRRFFMYQCSGMCHSYTSPSRDKLDQLERHCLCCGVGSARNLTSVIRCRRNDGQFNGVRIVVNFPESCRCRPCSDSPNIIPMEQQQYGVFGNQKRSKLTSVQKQLIKPTDNSTLERLFKSEQPFIYIDEPGFSISFKEIG